MAPKNSGHCSLCGNWIKRNVEKHEQFRCPVLRVGKTKRKKIQMKIAAMSCIASSK